MIKISERCYYLHSILFEICNNFETCAYCRLMRKQDIYYDKTSFMIGLSGLICKFHGYSSTIQIAQWWRPRPRSSGGSYFNFQCGVESNPFSSKKWPSCPLGLKLHPPFCVEAQLKILDEDILY